MEETTRSPRSVVGLMKAGSMEEGEGWGIQGLQLYEASNNMEGDLEIWEKEQCVLMFMIKCRTNDESIKWLHNSVLKGFDLVFDVFGESFHGKRNLASYDK